MEGKRWGTSPSLRCSPLSKMACPSRKESVTLSETIKNGLRDQPNATKVEQTEKGLSFGEEFPRAGLALAAGIRSGRGGGKRREPEAISSELFLGIGIFQGCRLTCNPGG